MPECHYVFLNQQDAIDCARPMMDPHERSWSAAPREFEIDDDSVSGNYWYSAGILDDGTLVAVSVDRYPLYSLNH